VPSSSNKVSDEMLKRTQSLFPKPEKGPVIAPSPIIRIAAMLTATQIVAMLKVSIVCIQNRQPWMSADFFSKSRY
jgi:hypothetical protein